MKVTRQKNRALFNLSLMVIITILFSLLSLSIDFIDTIREYFPFYNTLPINDFFVNIIFLWLVVTLGITYQRWRGAVSERRELEDIIASINTDVLVVVDRNGTITMCNDSVKGVFDYRVHEVLNKKIDLFYSPSHSSRSKRNMIIEKLERDGFYIELATGTKKNGEIIPLEVVIYNRKNRDGAVLLLRDITERKRTEEKLERYRKQLETLLDKRTHELTKGNKQLQEEINVRKQSNEQLEKTRDYLDNIIESSLDPIVIVDTSGCITRVNASLLKMLGYTEEEVMGRHTTEFSPSVAGSYESTTGKKVEITEDLIKQSKEMLAQLFETGKIYNWERYFVRRDQKVVPVESNIVFLYDSEGNMTGGVGILRDVTERKKAEEESNEARNFLENIFETTADGIMVTDGQGCIVKVNRAIEHMLGYREDELVGRFTSELAPQNEDRAKTRAVMFEQLFEKGYVKHWETEWSRKDGSLCPVEINITFLKDLRAEGG
jgi:PAS domain S-box-containing protein